MDGFSWKEVAGWLFGTLVAGLQLVGLYQIKRIGALEESKADKADVDNLKDEVKNDMRDLILELRDERKVANDSRVSMHEKINKVAETVAEIRGEMGTKRRR